MFPKTYHGLEKWHCHLFQKFGWMLIAKESGRELELGNYLECIDHLIKGLQEKIAITEERDRINDLSGLLESSQILYKYAVMVFSPQQPQPQPPQTGGRRKRY